MSDTIDYPPLFMAIGKSGIVEGLAVVGWLLPVGEFLDPLRDEQVQHVDGNDPLVLVVRFCYSCKFRGIKLIPLAF